MTRHHDTVARASRFLLVGGCSTVAYVAIAGLLADGLGMHPHWAGGCSYLVLLPVNFLAHRDLTFRSVAADWATVMRFLSMHGLTALGAAGAMHLAVAVAGLSAQAGALCVAILAPLANFVMMHLWVFPPGRRPVAPASQRDR